MDPAAHTAFGDAQGVRHFSVAEALHLVEDQVMRCSVDRVEKTSANRSSALRASTRFSTEARSSGWMPMSSGSTGSVDRLTRLRSTSVHRFEAIR